MSFFGRGDEPVKENNTSNNFWRPDPKVAANVAYVLPPSLANILVASKYGVFKVSGGPTNASWIDIGAKDMGNELGLKSSPKAFVWVLVPNDPKAPTKGFSVKMWEASKTHFAAIATQVQEFGFDLQGLMIVMGKSGNRWNIAVNKAPAARAIPEAVLQEEWAKIQDQQLDGSDEMKLGKMIGLIETPELEKKFLIERIQREDPSVVNWSGVLRKFGIGTAESDDPDIETF